MKKQKAKDEHEIRIFNNAQTAGVIVVVAICIFFFVINFLMKGTFSFDYAAIMFVYLSMVCFYSFAKFKNIYHFIIGLGFVLVFACMLVMYYFTLIN